ncbi:MAG: ribonucleoside-diphosphate reductase subunit alpha [Cellvibrionales bacterium]|nr:ribonucleoside-diphosphate reductase subunit alpha [Cellvibrionales bacterium]
MQTSTANKETASTDSLTATTDSQITDGQLDGASPKVNLTAPGQIRVIKRNGNVVGYTDDKISVAITKAFLAVEGDKASLSSRIRETVEQLTLQVSATFKRRMPSGGTIHIEDIQDQVELALMRSGEHKVAQAYVLYRAEQAKKRAEHDNTVSGTQPHPSIMVVLENGEQEPLDMARFEQIVVEACADLTDVNAKAITDEALKNLYSGVSIKDLNTSLVMTARTLIEQEPNYTYVTARLLLDSLRREALQFLNVAKSATQAEMSALYKNAFPAYIDKGIELGLLSEDLKGFDLKKLGAAILPERDYQFTYLGLQTLYDRYFLHSEEVRFELPQIFYMRVAMGLALQEKQKNEKAIEFYRLLSSFDYMSSTPTLFNSGTLRPQLSSCYLSTVPDDLFGIYGAIQDNAMLSKWAGGLGNDWTPVRALGASIKGTNGKSQGVVPFLKVVNDTAVAVNQGGKRKGAVCAYLESWHLDIEEFLELRKNTGDDRRRTHDMNSANWVPDLFMQRVFEDGEWTLFSPNDTPDLHDLYGKAFKNAYEAYEEKTRTGELKLFKRISAKELWRKMLGMLFETGHPWITFKDPCNIRSPQQHVGVVHSSNLCTEITLNTKADEVAVCNLGSVNLAQHIDDGKLNHEKLQKTVKTAIRMLDNVVDINYYAIEQARNSNLKHRPIGLGLMGFQDALYQLGISYSSDEAVAFADESMEAISYYAIEASSDLAKERGAYSTYKGSLWSQDILPIDSVQRLIDERGSDFIEVDQSSKLDWAKIRKKIKANGMRNSNVMAIAPTATIANITGVSQSIEPTYQNLYVKSNLSGEFTIVNPYLVKDLKALGLWDNVMIHDLKYYEGSLQAIERIPPEIKQRYATAFEVEPRWLVDAASRRQKWIDQAQSLNLYINEANGRKLDITYRMAWYRGLKTTYYLRALSATTTEKSTVNTGTLNAVSSQSETPTEPQAAPVPLACSIDDPDCEACQ